jgi:2-oxoisovalerate dehydrogenase E1 component
LPKSLIVTPESSLRRGELAVARIPINAYDGTLEDARRSFGDAAACRVLRDMVVIREFETMLGSFKRTGRYGQVVHDYAGPAHLSIGQEASAVGLAAALELDDHVFGSHRSHGEVIAKGLAAIARLEEDELEAVTTGWRGGAIASLVERHVEAAGTEERGIAFLLYGLLAEIFGRETGFNRGLAGSMHAFFPPFGIYPNNAIVGASAPIAVGAALYKRLHAGGRGVTVASIGDGATGCGVVWEAINFAGMRQLRSLWDERYRGGLPVLFFFVDNFYAMGGQTAGETMSYDRLGRIACGFDEAALHVEVVDGSNPFAVADAVRRKRPLLEAGDGPVLLDVLCYRQAGHSSSDASAYRTNEERELWRALDPIDRLAAELEQTGLVAEAHVEGVQASVRALLGRIALLVIDDARSPRLSLTRRGRELERLMFSDGLEEPDPQVTAELSIPLERSERLAALAGRDRTGITIRDALVEAIAYRFAHDPTLIAYGEENRDWGGAFGVYRGLTELLPYHRLFNAPISEAAIVGTAVGYAAEGGRALVELMYADFIGRAGDELLNQLAKWQAMSGGLLRMRVVVRVSVGTTYGAQHSQDWTGIVGHVPGLRVVYPATPYDAKGLMASALSGTDPVIFFESQALYDRRETFRPEGVPRGHYRVPLGEADVKRAGRDLTIVSTGATLYRAAEAAGRLEDEFGVSAELIDARSLVPFDERRVSASVRKTHRLLLVSDAVEQGNFTGYLAARLQERCFDDLDAPVVVLGALDAIAPPAEFEHTYLVQPDHIVETVHERLLPLSRRS